MKAAIHALSVEEGKLLEGKAVAFNAGKSGMVADYEVALAEIAAAKKLVRGAGATPPAAATDTPGEAIHAIHEDVALLDEHVAEIRAEIFGTISPPEIDLAELRAAVHRAETIAGHVAGALSS